MIYGLYLSAQGAEAQAARQAVLANNMANAQTTGFKRDIPVFRAFPTFDVAEQNPVDVPPDLELQTGGVMLSGTVTDFSPGPLEVTNGEFDLAITGPGFFSANVRGETLLTRNGKLALGPQGMLVTADHSHPVLDASGQPIVIPEGFSQLAVSADGQMSARGPGGEQVILAQLGVLHPLDVRQLEKVGDGFFRPRGTVDVAVNAQVRQGMLEGSSTDPVHGMVDLIETSRSFEMNMNLVRYQDEMLGQLISSVARK